MGSLALRPCVSLTILVDGFVNRLQDFQFPSFLLFELRGLDFYPGGTLTHCSCQPSLDAHFRGTISARTPNTRNTKILHQLCRTAWIETIVSDERRIFNRTDLWSRRPSRKLPTSMF